ncbi:MAG: hypothetical protein K2N74_05960 [Clostridiales bacterium]|nr:hypothetical protein [Clostridiales bacterium]
MKNKKTKYPKELLHEPDVSAQDFLAELVPLLSDYFEGKIAIINGSVFYFLPNGQKIILTAQQG